MTNQLPEFLEKIIRKSSKSYSTPKKGDGKGNVSYKQLELLCKRQQIIIKRLIDSQIQLNTTISEILLEQFIERNTRNNDQSRTS